MAVQYAGGTIVNDTFTQTLLTRAELAGWIKDRLVLAGWTVVATAANDWKLNSGITAQGLQMRVRVYDPGTGSTARIKPSNVAETRIHTNDFFLFATAARTWRITANRYQCFIQPTGVDINRDVAQFGVPYIPPFLEGITTEAIWGISNAASDGDTARGRSFRFGLENVVNNPNQFLVYNGTFLAPTGGTPVSTIRLFAMGSPWVSTGNVYNIYRWSNDYLVAYEPLIAYGIASNADEARIRGQLWDSIVLTGGFDADATIAFDGRTYRAITVANYPTGFSGSITGTLLVAIT